MNFLVGRRLAACGALLAALAAACSVGAPDTDGDAEGSTLARATCPTALKRCGHTITFPDHGESSVEVRGNFDGDASWSTGVPMHREGGVWVATLRIPYDKPIQYKFVVDGVWCCEAGAEDAGELCADHVPNPFGTMNRVIEVR